MNASRRPQDGFTYMGLLVAIVIMGMLLTVASRVWAVSEQREREAQLLFVGGEIRTAIGRYFAVGGQYPQSLQDLLDDKRSPVPRRYLRRIYYDPMTNTTDWNLVPAPAGGIMGVSSKSLLKPIKRTGFSSDDAALEANECYCTWQFVFQPRYYRRSPVANPGQNQP
jgi:type II secretory pathway pseudopilin PulG